MISDNVNRAARAAVLDVERLEDAATQLDRSVTVIDVLATTCSDGVSRDLLRAAQLAATAAAGALRSAFAARRGGQHRASQPSEIF